MGALSLCWVSIHLLHWRGIGTGSYASTGARWLSPCLCSRRAAAGTTPSSATPPSTKSAWTPSPPSAGRYEKPPAPSLRISPSFCHGVVASRGQGRTRPAPFFGAAERGFAWCREERGFAACCGRWAGCFARFWFCSQQGGPGVLKGGSS